MMLLKDATDVELLLDAVNECEGDVYLRSMDGSDTFNLKSVLSRYIAIGELCKDHGDEYEVFCANKDDDAHMLKFFTRLRKHEEEIKHAS